MCLSIRIYIYKYTFYITVYRVAVNTYNHSIRSIATTVQGRCCRESGVPDICLGFCVTIAEDYMNTKVSDGGCMNHVEAITKCRRLPVTVSPVTGNWYLKQIILVLITHHTHIP